LKATGKLDSPAVEIIVGLIFLIIAASPIHALLKRGEMKWIWIASEFVRKVRCQMRYGELSRVPLKFLRFELREDYAACEWLLRPNDPWDRDLSEEIREQNETSQALHDALTVREFLFASIPEIKLASLKVYRPTKWQSRELVITGAVNREDVPPPRIASLVMRAMLYGLHFRLMDGVLGPLDLKPDEPEFRREASCHGRT